MSAKTTTTVASADESKQTPITGVLIFGLPRVGDPISEELDKITRVFKHKLLGKMPFWNIKTRRHVRIFSSSL